MGDVLQFPEKGSEDLSEDLTVIICGECEGVDFTPWIHKGELIFVCSNELCGQVYALEDFEEDEEDGV